MDLLRHLKFFTAIAEEQHFGRAAGVLGMTQPPLSQGLQRLEADLGLRLFDRGSREVSLTPAGRELLAYAYQVLESAQELREVAAKHVGGQVGLRLGVTPQLPAAVSTALAQASAGAMDGERVQVSTLPTTTLIEQVGAGRLDLAVVHHPAVLGSLSCGQVVRLPTTALLPDAHPVAARGRGPLRAFTALPVAVPPRAHQPAVHDLLVDTLTQHGLTGATIAAEDERAALALVATGQAIALTADPLLSAHGVARCRIDTDPVPLRIRSIYSSANRTGTAFPQVLLAASAVLHAAPATLGRTR